jgi:hypothetical protein
VLRKIKWRFWISYYTPEECVSKPCNKHLILHRQICLISYFACCCT